MVWPFKNRDYSLGLPESSISNESVFDPQLQKIRFQVASDVGHRDGLGLELFDDEHGVILAEAFRFDDDKALTFRCGAAVDVD